MHGDGCFHTGPIPLSLTGKYDINYKEVDLAVQHDHVDNDDERTGCTEDQFTCTSGLCVDMERR